jgi:16S rRNA (uracil1498-N3)-methyltransferase
MRLHRFFIETELVSGMEITIEKTETIHQWLSVFRCKAGDRVILFNGNGNDYEAEFLELHKKKAVLNIILEKESTALNKNSGNKVHLYMSVIKKDLFELVVEKATELGVTSITPILTERTQDKNLNMDRLKKIAIESSEQSGRGDVPMINSAVSLEVALEGTKGYSISVADLDHTGDKEKIKILSSFPQVLFIGPEGGWGEKDYTLFKKYPEIKTVSLGETVLRAETAAIVGCFMLLNS